jgi:hypothetical protein
MEGGYVIPYGAPSFLTDTVRRARPPLAEIKAIGQGYNCNSVCTVCTVSTDDPFNFVGEEPNPDHTHTVLRGLLAFGCASYMNNMSQHG